ncbi:hypothetical protein [Streptosporangium canum]|uniref:hypothetical protein n=1 Tax=Streptosporangium canum TaxID=324952 RepID=UPI0037951A66
MIFLAINAFVRETGTIASRSKGDQRSWGKYTRTSGDGPNGGAGGPAQVLARPELPPDASLSLRFNVGGTGEYLLYVHKWRAYRVGLADAAVTSVPITVDERPGEGDSPRAA